MTLSRRRLLTLTGASCMAGIAGCLGDDDEVPEIDESIPIPEDHPELFEEDFHRDEDFVLYWFWVPNTVTVGDQIEFLVDIQEEYPELTIVSLNRRDEDKGREYVQMLQAHFGINLDEVDEEFELPATAIGDELHQGNSPETRTAIKESVENCSTNGCRNALDWRDERLAELEEEWRQEIEEERDDDEEDEEVNEDLERRRREIEEEEEAEDDEDSEETETESEE